VGAGEDGEYGLDDDHGFGDRREAYLDFFADRMRYTIYAMVLFYEYSLCDVKDIID
jgi:hypothetical protein